MQNIDDYQLYCRRTVNPEGDDVRNYALGLAGEAGEVADFIKKCCYQGHMCDDEIIKKELGDIMWYVSNMAYLHCLKMSDILQANNDKLQKRYPNGFEASRSIIRED